MSAQMSGLPESGHGWAIYESLDRRDVALRQRHSLLAAEQLQQNLDSLLRLHVGEDRQVIAERSRQDPDAGAELERGGRGQLDKPVALAAADFGDDVVGD